VSGCRYRQAGAVALAVIALAACGGGAGGGGTDSSTASSASAGTPPSSGASSTTSTSPAAPVQTSQSGSVLYLQSTSGGHTARIGLDTAWGGAIVEASLDGTNYVNAHDTGREVQPSLYDGADSYDDCAGCTGTWGWNPVLGGDRYGHGSPVLASSVGADSIYVKAQPLQWYPDAFGGGAGTPERADVIVEQTVALAPGAPLAFQVHVTLTYTGSAQHYNMQQELPAVFENAAGGTIVYYGGTKPWTAGALSSAPVPALPALTALLYVPEHWAAIADTAGMGLTVYVPGQYPYVTASSLAAAMSGPQSNGFYYLHPFTTLTVGPGSVLDEDIYLVPGSVAAARGVVTALHASLPAQADIFPPLGNFETPAAGATISGKSVPVGGWAFDNVAMGGVVVRVDGAVAGRPELDIARPDVVAAYPHLAPLDSGWLMTLDTTKLANGAHTISVGLTDAAGNVAELPPVGVTVAN
jgi:hypothetical protein